jgi:hypothetical protein
MHLIDWITGSIIDSAMRIHSALGPGLFESVYEVVLERDLVRGGFRVERQKAIGFVFEGLHFENAFVLLKHGIKRIVKQTGRGSRPRSAPPRAPREMIPLSYFFIQRRLRKRHHTQVCL